MVIGNLDKKDFSGVVRTEAWVDWIGEGMEKDISCKWKWQKCQGSNTHIDKIDFKTKAIKKDKEGHYIMIKGSIQEEDITPINIYAPNIGAPKYIKQQI